MSEPVTITMSIAIVWNIAFVILRAIILAAVITDLVQHGGHLQGDLLGLLIFGQSLLYDVGRRE